jgi:hypothetical protein
MYIKYEGVIKYERSVVKCSWVKCAEVQRSVAV